MCPKKVAENPELTQVQALLSSFVNKVGCFEEKNGLAEEVQQLPLPEMANEMRQITQRAGG